MKYEDRELLPAKWGLVNSWAKDAKRAASQINARAETLESRYAFKALLAKRRCVVPADGFFEWTGPTRCSPSASPPARVAKPCAQRLVALQ